MRPRRCIASNPGMGVPFRAALRARDRGHFFPRGRRVWLAHPGQFGPLESPGLPGEPDIGCDGPAIDGWNLSGVLRHDAKPFVMTSKKWPIGAPAVAGCGTTVAGACSLCHRASPVPTRPWHGVQKISKRSGPRAKSSLVSWSPAAGPPGRRGSSPCRTLHRA